MEITKEGLQAKGTLCVCVCVRERERERENALEGTFDLLDMS